MFSSTFTFNACSKVLIVPFRLRPDSTDDSLAVVRSIIEENVILSQVLLSPLMIYATLNGLLGCENGAT
jgi:hypothetical protein